jgi:hypothetical protein
VNLMERILFTFAGPHAVSNAGFVIRA